MGESRDRACASWAHDTSTVEVRLASPSLCVCPGWAGSFTNLLWSWSLLCRGGLRSGPPVICRRASESPLIRPALWAGLIAYSLPCKFVPARSPLLPPTAVAGLPAAIRVAAGRFLPWSKPLGTPVKVRILLCVASLSKLCTAHSSRRFRNSQARLTGLPLAGACQWRHRTGSGTGEEEEAL